LKTAEYKTPDLAELVEEYCKHLNRDKKALVLTTLKEFEEVLKGREGNTLVATLGYS